MLENWINANLEDIAEIVGGGTPSRNNSEFWNGDIPWATPTDITHKKNRMLLSTKEFITEEGLNKSSAKLLPPGTVLMTSRATIGECAINLVPMATNQGFANFICNDKALNKFVYYLLTYYKSDFEKLGSGSTFKEISKKTLKSFSIKVPPIVEQNSIAKILTDVDHAIDKTEEIIKQTQKVKKGLMQQLFTKGIGHSEYKKTEFGDIPEEWAFKKVSELASVEYGISEAVSENTNPEIGIPILTGANIRLDGKIDLSKIVYIEKRKQERFELKLGDLLFNWRSGSQHHVGKTAIFDLEGDYTYASFILRIRVNADCDYRFYYYLLNYLKESGYFLKDTSMQVNFKLNAASFRELIMVKPPIEEQREISKIIDSLENKLSAEIKRSYQLKEIKRGLMQVLLTGRVRVKVDTKEVITS